MTHLDFYPPITDVYGQVTQVNESLVVAEGLPKLIPNEVVIFPDSKILGKVVSYDLDRTQIMLLSTKTVKIGDKIYPTGKVPYFPVSDQLLGGVYDPLGLMLPGQASAQKAASEKPLAYPIDHQPPALSTRELITRQMTTGVVLSDVFLPIGHGQRELILGDNKLGKLTFLLLTAKHQAQQGAVVVWASIGKSMTRLQRTIKFFTDAKVFDNMVVIASHPMDAVGTIIQTPFAAMTVAEYFRDQGKDVIVVLDDLTTHAKFYREIALLNRQFPGRDSYPGDIFFLHARLLERAGCFKNKLSPTGQSSITCLPVAETINSDVTDFIASNLISITDGHLLFDPSTFQKGHRPAIKVSLSVTRVGKQTQPAVVKELNLQLTRLLHQFERTKELSSFSSELGPESQMMLQVGHVLEWAIEQTTDTDLPYGVQITLLMMILQNILYQADRTQVHKVRQDLIAAYSQDKNWQAVMNGFVNAGDFKTLETQFLSQVDSLKQLCQL